MFSHVFLGVSDFERALAFYSSLMHTLGAKLRFIDRRRPWAGWHGDDGGRPLLLIGAPFDRHPSHCGNGLMVALDAADRETVDRAFAAAISAGGSSEGEPGPRPHYHAHYYGAYFRDPDRNKLCVVCHRAPDRPASPLFEAAARR